MITPLLILVASLPAIRRSERPLVLTGIVLVMGIVVGGLSWGILAFTDRIRRR
jgi:hypothetical protein